MALDLSIKPEVPYGISTYDSLVCLVVRQGTVVPEMDILKHAMVYEVRSDCRFWYWDFIDWSRHGREVMEFISTLPDEDYLLLRDGEERDDFEIKGYFNESDFAIGIVIPPYQDIAPKPITVETKTDQAIDAGMYIWHTTAVLGMLYMLSDLVNKLIN